MAHTTKLDATVETAYPPGMTVIRRGSWERIPWRGVFAGAAVAIAIQTLLMLIGIGIGMVSVDSPMRMDGVALAEGIWWLIAGTIAIFIGAWVAGRMTIPRDTFDGAITGAVTWAVLTVVSLWLATAAAMSVVGGAYAVTANAAQALLDGNDTNVTVERTAAANQGRTASASYVDVGSTDGSVNASVNWAALGDKVESVLNRYGIQTSGIDLSQQFEKFGDAPVANTREFYGRVRNYLENGNEVDRRALVDYLAANTEMTEAEINNTLDNWQQQYQELKADAIRVANEATEAASDFVGEASLWTSFALALGLVAGCVGGAVGVPGGPAVMERTTPDRAPNRASEPEHRTP